MSTDLITECTQTGGGDVPQVSTEMTVASDLLSAVEGRADGTRS